MGTDKYSAAFARRGGEGIYIPVTILSRIKSFCSTLNGSPMINSNEAAVLDAGVGVSTTVAGFKEISSLSISAMVIDAT